MMEELSRAVAAAERGAGRAEAVSVARRVLEGACGDDAFWRASLVLVHAGEIALAHRHWGAAVGVDRDVHAVLGGRIMLLRGEVCAAVRLLDGAVSRGVRPALRTNAVAWLARALVEAGELGGARAVLEDGHPRGAVLRSRHPDNARLDNAHPHAAVLGKRRPDSAKLDTGRPDGATFDTGRPDGARLGTGRPDGATPGSKHLAGAELCFARGWLLLAEGQGAAALDEFLDCGRLLEAGGVVNPAVLPWRSAAALAAADRGDLVLARICADKELVAARRWGAPRAVGLALHASALARGGDVVLLEQAIACLGHAPEALRARHDLAQVLLARGEVDRARRHTRQLRDHPQWTRAADVLASRLLRNDGESALSGRQRRIALLARAGRSNREIAAELSLTLRTVEFHLTAVYRKMGVAGRAGLRRAFVPTS
ncbi:LuxR C-terminal-related transcriptional regulator [Lentzea sp. NPDC003310]|uniref:helix-turn-helix transcriptional regulator n=1 Tax=Lentzea sp. NPDC003310 TaxID=3154447 RepID=UPI0033A25861